MWSPLVRKSDGATEEKRKKGKAKRINEEEICHSKTSGRT